MVMIDKSERIDIKNLPEHLERGRRVFQDCVFTGALEGVSLYSGVTFAHCEFGQVKVTRCDLDFAEFSGSQFLDCSFVECTLQSAGFRNSTLHTPAFHGCNLRNVDFENCTLFMPSFRDSNISWIQFKRTTPYNPEDMLYAYVPGMSADNRILYGVFHSHRLMITTGCYWGTYHQFRKASTEKYGSNCIYNKLAASWYQAWKLWKSEGKGNP